jgi:hypothetical protein
MEPGSAACVRRFPVAASRRSRFDHSRLTKDCCQSRSCRVARFRDEASAVSAARVCRGEPLPPEQPLRMGVACLRSHGICLCALSPDLTPDDLEYRRVGSRHCADRFPRRNFYDARNQAAASTRLWSLTTAVNIDPLHDVRSGQDACPVETARRKHHHR